MMCELIIKKNREKKTNLKQKQPTYYIIQRQITCMMGRIQLLNHHRITMFLLCPSGGWAFCIQMRFNRFGVLPVMQIFLTEEVFFQRVQIKGWKMLFLEIIQLRSAPKSNHTWIRWSFEAYYYQQIFGKIPIHNIHLREYNSVLLFTLVSVLSTVYYNWLKICHLLVTNKCAFKTH